MFIELDDYKVVIGTTAFNVVTQADPDNLANAQLEAIEEISGYLRPRYDCAAIFGSEGAERNRQILMYACDISLYHLASSLPGKMGMEIRKERYERAIKWLESVQSGGVIPDLPECTTESGENAAPSIRYGSKQLVDNSY